MSDGINDAQREYEGKHILCTKKTKTFDVNCGSNPLLIEVTAIVNELLTIMIDKNSDYTNDNKDPFHNFKVTAELSGITVEQGIFNRSLDKVTRASALLKGKEASVKDESLMDTIKDGINYWLILLAYMRLNEK